MPRIIIETLPKSLLEKATLQGNEYAWSLRDIPEVIETSRLLGLLNRGGQLQFRIPDGTCEAYEFCVEPNRTDDCNIAATECLNLFNKLLEREHEFLPRGREWKVVREFEQSGGSLEDHMCFVWYLNKP